MRSRTTDPRRRPGRRRAPDARHAAAVRLPGGRADARSRTACRWSSSDLPGRPLVSATLVLRNGAADEPAGRGRRDGPRRPGADRGHRALRRDRPRRGRRAARRLAPRRGRLGRDVGRRRRARPPASSRRSSSSPRSPSDPTFPEAEVERLRDERLNDLLQAEADPRRRAEEAFVGDDLQRPARRTTGRPAGRSETVERLDADAPPGGLPARRSTRRASTLIVGGDLTRHRRRRRSPSGCSAAGARPYGRRRRRGSIVAESAVRERFVRVVHRPGSVQTEIRIGHRRAAAPDPGLPRAVGHGRDPRRAVQLAAEHEAPRGEGLHVRRGRRLRPAPRAPGRSPRGPRSTPRSPSRRSSTCSPSSTGSATSRVDGGRARGRPRLPRRRVPAAVRDAGAGRRRAGRAGRPRPARRRADALPRRRSRPSTIEAVQRGRRRTSDSTRRRSSSSATPTRSGRRSRPPGLGRIVIERDDVAGPRGRPAEETPRRPDRSTTRSRQGRLPAPRSRCRRATRTSAVREGLPRGVSTD